jgi:arylsulfatase A-like enzyme
MKTRRGVGRGATAGRPNSPLALALLLQIVFLALCYVRILGDANSAAFGDNVTDVILSQPIAGTTLGRNLLLFALVQIFIHLCVGLACFALALFADSAWKLHSCTRRHWIVLWTIAAIVWILIANSVYYPTSSLGAPYASFVANSWLSVDVLEAYSAVIAAAVICTLLKWLLRIDRPSASKLPRLTLAAAFALIVGLFSVARLNADAKGSLAQQPNVIIVGIDSLRPNATRRGDTPEIDAFLAESTTFSNATTPLARTFPAWVSILTGRHPHTTGAIMNLLPRDMIDTRQTLPKMLREAGYRTIYAIDEVRFSNIDESYGFDQTITPPIGATDFLLSFFSDVPLANILVNTAAGRRLFPFSHANRAMALTYDPDTFVDRLRSEMRVTRPTMLAVHLTLAHWPYNWAGMKAVKNDDTATALEKMYERALRRVDQQFGDVMSVLQERGLLENAIVVVLSDHGESLGAHGEGSTVSAVAEFDPEQAQGHGTSVFFADQYRVVLALRAFNTNALRTTKGTNYAVPTTLEDIAPTITELLSLKSVQPFDGLSLVPILRTPIDEQNFAARVRFTETEFNPAGISPGKLLTSSSLKSAASYYEVDPKTDRVTIKKANVQAVLATRQFAAFIDGALLAAIPSQDQASTDLRLAYMSSEDGIPAWVSDMASLDQLPHGTALWHALIQRFPNVRSRVTLGGTIDAAGQRLPPAGKSLTGLP